MQLDVIQNKIYELRGQKVMIGNDLAEMYGVQTKVLNQAVKRNIKRFPPDFVFQLTKTEVENLRSQIVTSKKGGNRYLPYAFTEQGVSMLSSVLNSDRAIEVNIAIMRTFVLIREHSMRYKDLQEKLEKLEKQTDKNFKEIYSALNLLIEERMQNASLNKRERIGFKTKSLT
jgi:hypothetical protein